MKTDFDKYISDRMQNIEENLQVGNWGKFQKHYARHRRIKIVRLIIPVVAAAAAMIVLLLSITNNIDNGPLQLRNNYPLIAQNTPTVQVEIPALRKDFKHLSIRKNPEPTLSDILHIADPQPHLDTETLMQDKSDPIKVEKRTKKDPADQTVPSYDYFETIDASETGHKKSSPKFSIRVSGGQGLTGYSQINLPRGIFAERLASASNNPESQNNKYNIPEYVPEHLTYLSEGPLIGSPDGKPGDEKPYIKPGEKLYIKPGEKKPWDVILMEKPVDGTCSENTKIEGMSYKHRPPITFGVSLGINLTPRFAFITGLDYSLYHSRKTIEYPGETKTEMQQLHYLGLPLRLNYTIYSKSSFEWYAGGGVIVEKCIYAKSETTVLKETNFLWSLAVTTGIQYNITRNFSIYCEPYCSYLLSETTLPSYRNDNALEISANFGIRVNL